MAMISLSHIIIVLLAFCSYLYIWGNVKTNWQIIETPFGKIEGIGSISRNGRRYSSFMGIPFAIPPIGKLRFQPPEPFGSWKGIRDATELPSICIQYDLLFKKIDGSEDCLYLNVYTPKDFKKNPDGKDLPVIVFIHGGSFAFGGSNLYGANYWMDEDVVLVTIHYRLGALGFLNTGDPEICGNMGMKDQVLALQWIQKGISVFGGNPDLVTIMGESAGGASVHYHMISPMSQGLFHRGISHSGTALSPWAFMAKPKENTKKLVETICPHGLSSSVMRCLQTIDASKIVSTLVEFSYPFSDKAGIYAPSIENCGGKAESTFLSHRPQEAANVANVPWILGVVPEEGAYNSIMIAHNETALEILSNQWDSIIPNLMIIEPNNEISKQIKRQYFGDAKTKFTKDDYRDLTNLFSDRFYFHATHTGANIHASKGFQAYIYIWNYKSGKSLTHALLAARGTFPVMLELLYSHLQAEFWKKFGWENPDYGISHVDDLQYFFKMIPMWDIENDSPHYKFSSDVIGLWTSFAKFGKPEKFHNVIWEPVKPGKDLKYLTVGHQPQMISEPFKTRLQFWKSLGF